MILMGEGLLRRVIRKVVDDYHSEKSPEGKDMEILFPVAATRNGPASGKVRKSEYPGGLLRLYCCETISGF